MCSTIGGLAACALVLAALFLMLGCTNAAWRCALAALLLAFGGTVANVALAVLRTAIGALPIQGSSLAVLGAFLGLGAYGFIALRLRGRAPNATSRPLAHRAVLPPVPRSEEGR